MFIYYKICYWTSMKFQNSNSTNTLIHYLDCFNTNYITFRSIESFKYYFFEMKNVCDVNYWFFKNIVFVEMKSSKLINYSTNMCRSSQGPTVTMKQESDIKMSRNMFKRLIFFCTSKTQLWKCNVWEDVHSHNETKNLLLLFWLKTHFWNRLVESALQFTRLDKCQAYT